MKYYSREIIVKDYQGKWGKAVYVPCTEFFKTNDEKFLEKANKGKRIRFEEACESIRKDLRRREANKIYSETKKLSNSEIYWRRKIK